ncbi:MAG: hypothetical protein ACREFF_03710 [Candidatus Udaeobacter sp.]
MSDRVPLHFAQVVKMAIEEGPLGPSGNLPEQKYITQSPPIWSAIKAFSVFAVALLGLTAIAGLCKPRRSK